MLYIIYGLTTIVTRSTKAFFKENDIDDVFKYTFETENTRIQPSDGILRRTDRSEVESCDYRYENNGRLVGFRSSQIEPAVNGQTDTLLTFSSDDLSFLQEIKNAYGDHVVTIYAYIEDNALSALTNALPAPADQKEARLEMGRAIKDRFIAQRALFDEVVLYSGENTQFDLENLKAQYAHLIKKYKEREKDLIPLPYTGNKPYIFVSYARADEETVIPYLRFLQKNGCRIWYDKGIRGGDNWITTLAMKLKGCSQYLLFSSANSTQSLWTEREISLAADTATLRILTVRMDDAHFNEGIEWVLSSYQQLFLSQPDFEDALLNGIDSTVVEQIGAE